MWKSNCFKVQIRSERLLIQEILLLVCVRRMTKKDQKEMKGKRACERRGCDLKTNEKPIMKTATKPFFFYIHKILLNFRFWFMWMSFTVIHNFPRFLDWQRKNKNFAIFMKRLRKYAEDLWFKVRFASKKNVCNHSLIREIIAVIKIIYAYFFTCYCLLLLIFFSLPYAIMAKCLPCIKLYKRSLLLFIFYYMTYFVANDLHWGLMRIAFNAFWFLGGVENFSF